MKISLITLLVTTHLLISCSSMHENKLDLSNSMPDSIQVISKINGEHYSSGEITQLNNKAGQSIWEDTIGSKPNGTSQNLIEPTGIGLAKAAIIAEREAARILGSSYKAKPNRWFLQKAEKEKSLLGYYYLFSYDNPLGHQDKNAYEDQLQLIILLDGTLLKTIKQDN